MQIWRILIATWTILLPSCSTEVGNPNPEKEEGKVQLKLASEDLDTAKSLTIAFEKVVLASETLGAPVELAPIGASVRLDPQTKQSADITDLLTVPQGTYKAILLFVDTEHTITYVDKNGESRSVGFDLNLEPIIVVPKTFVVIDGESLTLTITIDIESSLIEVNGTEAKIVFRPRGDVQTFKEQLKYEGLVKDSNVTLVCAYLYEPIIPLGFNKEQQQNESKRVPFVALPFSETKESLTKDEQPSCQNAFRKTRVRDRSFRFSFLHPGKYDFRGFYDDGKFVDLDAGVKIELKGPN